MDNLIRVASMVSSNIMANFLATLPKECHFSSLFCLKVLGMLLCTQVTPETKFVALNNPEELQQLRQEDNRSITLYRYLYYCGGTSIHTTVYSNDTISTNILQVPITTGTVTDSGSCEDWFIMGDGPPTIYGPKMASKPVT